MPPKKKIVKKKWAANKSNTPQAGASPTTDAAPDFKGRLTRLLEKYDPEKLESIDVLLEKFAGEEETLLQELTDMYGPEPEPERVDIAEPAAADKKPSITMRSKNLIID